LAVIRGIDAAASLKLGLAQDPNYRHHVALSAASLKRTPEPIGVPASQHTWSVISGIDAAASLKLPPDCAQSGTDCSYPRHRCRGLIEARPSACPARSSSRWVIRGIDAAASLKLCVGRRPGHGFAVIRGIDHSGKIATSDMDMDRPAYRHHRRSPTETAALQAKVLTDDEARRVAVNIARLPGFVGAARLTARRRRAQVARAGADTRARAVATSTTSEPRSGARNGP
jgi:hypothetical protein